MPCVTAVGLFSNILNSTHICNPRTGCSVWTDGEIASPVSEDACAAPSQAQWNHADAGEQLHHIREEELSAGSPAESSASGDGKTPELSTNVIPKSRKHKLCEGKNNSATHFSHIRCLHRHKKTKKNQRIISNCFTATEYNVGLKREQNALCATLADASAQLIHTDNSIVCCFFNNNKKNFLLLFQNTKPFKMLLDR